VEWDGINSRLIRPLFFEGWPHPPFLNNILWLWLWNSKPNAGQIKIIPSHLSSSFLGSASKHYLNLLGNSYLIPSIQMGPKRNNSEIDGVPLPTCGTKARWNSLCERNGHYSILYVSCTFKQNYKFQLSAVKSYHIANQVFFWVTEDDNSIWQKSKHAGLPSNVFFKKNYFKTKTTYDRQRYDIAHFIIGETLFFDWIQKRPDKVGGPYICHFRSILCS
jgi:hypothetical protein